MNAPRPPDYEGVPSPALQRYIDSMNTRMLLEDWIALGEELRIGRDWCREVGGVYTGKRGFGLWCAERGYHMVDARIRSAAIWLTSPEGIEFLRVLEREEVVLEHPLSIRAAFRRHNKRGTT